MKMGNGCTFLIGEPEGKVSLRRPRCRWKYNFKNTIEEIECESVDWIQLQLDGFQWVGGGVAKIIVKLWIV
jgi:hypothetical protein